MHDLKQMPWSTFGILAYFAMKQLYLQFHSGIFYLQRMNESKMNSFNPVMFNP